MGRSVRRLIRRRLNAAARGVYVAVFVWAWIAPPVAALPVEVTIDDETPSVFVDVEFVDPSVLHVRFGGGLSCAEFNTSWPDALDAYLKVYDATGALIAADDDGDHNVDSNCLGSKVHVTVDAGVYVVELTRYGTTRGVGFVEWGETYPTPTTSTTTMPATTSTSTTTSSSSTTVPQSTLPIVTSTTTVEPSTTTTSTSTTTPPTSSSSTTTTSTTTAAPITSTTSTTVATTTVPATTSTSTTTSSTTSTTVPPVAVPVSAPTTIESTSSSTTSSSSTVPVTVASTSTSTTSVPIMSASSTTSTTSTEQRLSE